ncbi:MAG: hypothetical protein V8S12_02020 [Lachnospiraceae bacterium]
MLDTKLGLTAAAAYHGKIREAQEVSACYQDADQILKGIVFSGGSRILETFPETSKEPLPKRGSFPKIWKNWKNLTKSRNFRI